MGKRESVALTLFSESVDVARPVCAAEGRVAVTAPISNAEVKVRANQTDPLVRDASIMLGFHVHSPGMEFPHQPILIRP